ncbi:MAG TPA: DsbA family protein [Candidatus Kryptonia bacterium]|nr:DsbA family protein [Candidatus Kryptonia bacterium]
MAVVVPVYFDYASSLCFIASVIGSRLEAELGVTLDWRPVEIAAQYPSWRKGALIGGDTHGKIARVASETGVPVMIPTRWLDSRAALQGALFARDHDRFDAYHARVFRAAFADGEDIGDMRVMERIAVAAGLTATEFADAVAAERYAPQLASELAEAQRLGVTGYPTFLLGRFPLTGIQPFETMRRLFARHIERQTIRVLH